MLDASGNLRSLEGVVPDIGGHTLTSDGMQSLRSVDPESLPLVEGTPRIGPVCPGWESFSVLGSTTVITRKNQGWRCRLNRFFS